MNNDNWNPEKDFPLTAGWGHAGQNNVTMPGRGRLTERQYTPEEKNAIGEAIHQLGKDTCDIYLNDIAYWKNIPARVWDYTIGGYQVIKKWLSYREKPLLGRPLKIEEVREVRNIARRIAAILMLSYSTSNMHIMEIVERVHLRLCQPQDISSDAYGGKLRNERIYCLS